VVVAAEVESRGSCGAKGVSGCARFSLTLKKARMPRQSGRAGVSVPVKFRLHCACLLPDPLRPGSLQWC